MPKTPVSKMLAPADIYKILKEAQDNGRLEYLAAISREIARLDPAYVAFTEKSKEETLDNEEPSASPKNGIQVIELKWSTDVRSGDDIWTCQIPEYTIHRWWEGDDTRNRTPDTVHFFVIDDDDNDRYGTLEEAMLGAQRKLNEYVNSYLVTPAPFSEKTADDNYKAGREAGLREAANMAADFVWKRYKDHDGIVGSHDYEKIREDIVELIEHPEDKEENDVTPKFG